MANRVVAGCGGGQPWGSAAGGLSQGGPCAVQRAVQPQARGHQQVPRRAPGPTLPVVPRRRGATATVGDPPRSAVEPPGLPHTACPCGSAAHRRRAVTSSPCPPARSPGKRSPSSSFNPSTRGSRYVCAFLRIPFIPLEEQELKEVWSRLSVVQKWNRRDCLWIGGCQASTGFGNNVVRNGWALGLRA